MIYEYKCSECGTIIERIMSIEEDHPKKVKCPECNTQTANRVFNNTNTHIPYDFNSPNNKIRTEKKPNKRFY